MKTQALGMVMGTALVCVPAGASEPAQMFASLTEAPVVALDAMKGVDEEDDAGWATLMNQYYGVPRGYSMTPVFNLGDRPLKLEKISAKLSVARGEVCGAGLYSIDIAHAANQRELTSYEPDAEGIVTLPADKQDVHKFAVTVYQPRFRGGRCTIEVSGKAAEATPPPEEAFEYAGFAHYEGGFRHHMQIDIAEAPRVKRFQLRVPAHCQGLEVVEAGTMTEGTFDAARLEDAERKIYAVAGGSARISAFLLSFNGPAGQTCDVPVYMELDTSEQQP